MINILTIPAYITIIKKAKPMRTGIFIKDKIDAKKTKQMGTPRRYQYNKAVVFLNIFSSMISLSRILLQNN
jgi:hypothetical protein